MKHDDMIAGMCLYGFINHERPEVRTRCLREIEQTFGRPIAMIVRDLMRSGRHGAAG